MTARPPLEQIEAAFESVRCAGWDHDDTSHALGIIRGLRHACEHALHKASLCQDPDLRAALLHPQWGVPAYLADAAGDVAQFFTTWDDRRADRAQDARDNKAADRGECEDCAMSKHTEGPWEWSRDDKQVVCAANGFPICDIRLSDEFSAELEANAALIAAAPDMLAALEEMMTTLWLDGPDAADIVNEEAVRKARAAIAKARGE